MASAPFKKNLWSSFLWYRFLELFQIKAGKQLPSRGRCPCCQSFAGTIFDDAAFGGIWFYCSHCQAAGDAVELAALLWRQTPAQVIAPLIEERAFLSPVAVEDYEISVAPRQRSQQFWLAIRGVASTGWSTIRSECPEFTGLPMSGHGLAGAVSPSAYREFFGVAAPRDAMALPLWDLPGRVAGFFLLESRGGAVERVSRRCPDWPPTGSLIFGQADSLNADRVFILPSPAAVAAAMAHDESAQLVRRPLLAIACGTKPPLVFLDCAVKPVIVGACELDTICLAADLDCRLAIAGDDLGNTSAIWQAEVLARAKPWPECLAALAAIDSLQASMVANRLADSRGQWERRLLASPPSLRAQLMACYADQVGRRTRYRGRTILETARGWQHQSGMISDAVLRVTEIRQTPRRLCYKGAIFQHGQRYDFETTVPLARRANQFMIDFLAAAGACPPQIDQRWRKCLYELAVQFHAPQVVAAPRHYGWQSNGDVILPGCKLSSGGVVAPVGLVPVNDLPGKNLPAPSPFLAEDIQQLNQPWMAVIWPLLRAVLETLAVAATGQAPRGFVLADSDGSRSLFLDILTIFGCQPRIATWSPDKDTNAAQPWPLLLKLNCFTEEAGHWASDPARRVLLFTRPLAGDLLNLHGWDVLRLTRRPRPLLTPQTRHSLAKLLPNFWQFERSINGLSRFDVLELLRQFAASHCLAAIDKRVFVRPGRYPLAALVRLLRLASRTGRLLFQDGPRSCVLSPAACGKFSLRERLPPWNWPQIIHLLDRHGLLAGSVVNYWNGIRLKQPALVNLSRDFRPAKALALDPSSSAAAASS